MIKKLMILLVVIILAMLIGTLAGRGLLQIF